MLFESRPRTSGMKFGISVGGLLLLDKLTEDTIFPCLVGSQNKVTLTLVTLIYIYTRMGSKVMPLANFHRNCWGEDKTHALYVFSILSPFNRCINCTFRHNISREIYFCTNPTHRRLSKMIGRSVENEIEIRADIKTRALLSRGSTDIYADIFTVYVSNSISFSTVCRQVRGFSVGVGSVTSAPKYCRSKSASSPKIVIKNYIVKSDAKIYFSADCGHGWHFKSICTALLAKYFENEEGKHLVGPTFAQ